MSYLNKQELELLSSVLSIEIVQIKILDSFYKKQNIQVKMDIFREKRNQYFLIKNKNSSLDATMLEFAAFYNAINYYFNLNLKANLKNKSMSTSEMKKYNSYSIKSSMSIKRISKKENILLDKSSIINELILSNCSLRDISYYISRRHNIEISHTYISRIIKKYPKIFKYKD